MRSMNFVSAAIGLALAAAIAHAPAIASEASADAAAPVFNPHGFQFPAGVYRCELNRSVHVRQVSADLQSAVLNWNKKDYTLRAVNARTGALRYEDPKSGLVWLVIVGKSMLLDTKLGRQLANECKT
ncbi:MAG: MliC family protein [Burkholderiales bacterium]|nr:MliC family protein [Burkholderiales bacterium]